jgi:hypothetical protein
MSLINQATATIENIKMTRAVGLYKNDSAIFPLKSKSIDRVPPQPGQGMPVKLLIKQVLTLVLIGKRMKYP